MMQKQNLSAIQSGHYIETSFEGISDVSIRVVGQLDSDGNFEFAKFNNALNIHFVYAGAGVLISDGRRFEVKAHDVFVLFPGHHVHYYDFYDTPWCYDWFTMAIPEDAQVIDNIQLTPESPVKTFGETSVIWKKAQKIAATLRTGNYSTLYPVSAAWQIIDMVYRQHTAKELDVADKIREYIDSNDSMTTLNDLADHFNMDRSTIYRVFKNKFKLSVKEYVDNQRYRNVCELLKLGDMSIAKIASYCGFDNPHYFSRAFRKRFGMSPTTWREQQAEADNG